MSAITPRQRRMLRAAKQKAEPDPSERGGELNIVPFLDIVVNLMLFLLATSAVTMAVAQIEADLPATCGGPNCPRVPPALDLSVTIVDSGILVGADGGFLAPGCEEVSRSVLTTVPRNQGGHDYEALRACAERVHAAHPHEQSVIITADPEVAYEDVIATMDAMRGTDEAPLFPRVRLAAGVRMGT